VGQITSTAAIASAPASQREIAIPHDHATSAPRSSSCASRGGQPSPIVTFGLLLPY
jgi:hypothetical protein